MPHRGHIGQWLALLAMLHRQLRLRLWSGRAPAHVRAAMRPKRQAGADAAGGGHSPHHDHAKRARRGQLPGGIRVRLTASVQSHSVLCIAQWLKCLHCSSAALATPDAHASAGDSH